MRSFEHGYLLETPVSHSLLITMRAVGEFRGRQGLYTEQFPEVLETLRQVAMIQSTESSNRIEGITVLPGRVADLVAKKSKPRDRSEQEVAGYRDVLASIHANHSRLRLSTDLILGWHRTMYHYTGEQGGRWKAKDNAITEVRPDGRQVVRFRPASAISTPKFMDRLVRVFNEALVEPKTDPLLLIASFVFDFECIHPFADGNGRVGRLLALLLLYQSGYQVGRYISLERIVEESKETYYDSLLQSSRGWHSAEHDLRPWWEYFLGMLTAAYKEFESRVGTLTTARGAKREMVQNAIQRLPDRFRLGDLQRACPGVSYPTLKRALADLKREGKLRCLGKGRDAEWERTGSRNR
ncbi:MAG TPA: Fic family protein [Phycisphaerae bacterium]|nr:Fic family protein [Phycisphaerae bacterium]HRY69809.1 Fic family protein [Phycisphaerae bacterium]HSA25358.1 Fic family protein [Phycisphaerae bacterium]